MANAADQATQDKLNALAQGLSGLMTHIADMHDRDDLRDEVTELRTAGSPAANYIHPALRPASGRRGARRREIQALGIPFPPADTPAPTEAQVREATEWFAAEGELAGFAGHARPPTAECERAAQAAARRNGQASAAWKRFGSG